MRENPADTRFRESDGVAVLIASEVRAIGHIRTDPSDPKSDKVYVVDAIHRPILKSDLEPKDNLAHCQIECDPFVKPEHFKKRLREALASIATAHGWVMEPGPAEIPPADPKS